MYKTSETQEVRYACLLSAHIQNSDSFYLLAAMGIYKFIETLQANIVMAKKCRDAAYIENSMARIYKGNHKFWELLYAFWQETGIPKCLLDSSGQFVYVRHELFGES